jgi:hypothetical protein
LGERGQTLLVCCNEEDGFVARETVSSYALPASVRYGWVRLVIDSECVRVIWRGDPGYLGAPSRDGPEKEAFVVGAGSWGRVRYNGRLTEDEGWWYRKIVLNVGNFGSASGDDFLTRDPDFSFDQIALHR